METFLPEIVALVGAVVASVGASAFMDRRNNRNTVAQHVAAPVAAPVAEAPAPRVLPHTHEYRIAASEVTMGEKIVIKVCWRCEPGTSGRIVREVVDGSASPE